MRAKRVVPEVSQLEDRAAYMRLYRQRRRDVYRRSKERIAARQAALRHVATRHPKELERELDRELRKRGLA